MRRKHMIITAAAVVLLSAAAAAIVCNRKAQASAWPGKELPQLSSTAKQTGAATEFALPMRALENARPLLRNPDRGLRMETYITLGETPESYPGNTEDPYEKMLGFIAKYEEESPTVVQLYVYLTRYGDKPLDGDAFEQLERMLALLRDNGIRALLRFAYQNESHPDAAWPQVKEHLHQIAEWFQSHGQLVEDTVFAVQAGIVGHWGEGHGNVNFKNKHIGRAFALLCHIIPEDIYVQVRTVDLMKQIPPKYKGRIGMHDDYLIGEPHGSWNFFLGRNGKAERQAQKGFWRTINDGEMPWGVATYYDRADGHPLDSMEALPILQQLKQYSLTTLSLEHNYREDVPGRTFTMARWRGESLSQAQLDEAGLPYHPELLNKSGMINTFDYIRYHLGYLLSIPSFELDSGSNQARFTIQNNGFAAPLSLGALSLVIGGEEYLVGSYDKYALGSMRAVSYTVDLPDDFDASGGIGVKLARRAGSPLSARFLNDTAFENGVQTLMAAAGN